MSSKVTLYFIGAETAEARRYSRLPKHRNPTVEDFLWVPKSIVEHTSKTGDMHILTLPDWFVEKEKL